MPGTNFPGAKAAVIFRPYETIAAAFLLQARTLLPCNK